MEVENTFHPYKKDLDPSEMVHADMKDLVETH